MKRCVIAAMTAFTAPTIAAVFAAGIAHADNAPQPGAACMAMTGAQTISPQGEALLCVPGGPAYVWQHLDGIQRPVQIWFTYGPDSTLAAGDVTPGENWVGFGGHGCSVAQTSTGGGPPVVKQIQDVPDYTGFQLLPDLATVTFKGACTWRKSGPSPYGP
jgi:hypothetical protein